MSALEKKLCTALDALIDDVVALHPELSRSLKKVRRVLRAMATGEEG